MPNAHDETRQKSSLPLQIGSTLRGFRFEYRVEKLLGTGGRGHAYGVVATRGLDDQPPPSGECVLKTVRIDERRSPDEVFTFAGRVHQLLMREFRALRRLSNLPCIPEVYDFGIVGMTLKGRGPQNTDETVPLTFIVRQQVNGIPLEQFLKHKYGIPPTESDAKEAYFSGIPEAQEWFFLARKLTTALLQIQQREVVHRDIWHENILVDGDSIFFIDFGDAYLRQELATERPNDRSDPFVAPEVRIGSRWPSRRADIYSLGGVLFLMATGQSPPNPPISDDDALKRHVTQFIADHNPQLLHANHGVADIIARCLRSDHHRRIKDAEVLLDDLSIFDTNCERLTLSTAFSRLAQQVEGKAGSGLPSLFSEMAAVELNHLSNVIEGMQLGSVDINGDHEQLAQGFAHYLSVLEKGDEYFSVSTAEFWAPSNAGINGRVLSMNRILAQRGVAIKRLFLVTPDELEDRESLFHQVAGEHLRKCNDLPAETVWQTFVSVVDPVRKADAIDFFEHSGVWIKKEHAVKILPVYTRQGQERRILRALRIRRYDGDVQIIRQEFEEMIENANPLQDVLKN
jgi:serine/threonine protein kinase